MLADPSMTALSINRPQEASDYFKEFDWKRMGGTWSAYWSLSATAHHRLEIGRAHV